MSNETCWVCSNPIPEGETFCISPFESTYRGSHVGCPNPDGRPRHEPGESWSDFKRRAHAWMPKVSA